jgi:hypothetical protein
LKRLAPRHKPRPHPAAGDRVQARGLEDRPLAEQLDGDAALMVVDLRAVMSLAQDRSTVQAGLEQMHVDVEPGLGPTAELVVILVDLQELGWATRQW